MNVSNGKTKRGQPVELLGNNKKNNNNDDDDDDDVELNYKKIVIIGISVESF